MYFQLIQISKSYILTCGQIKKSDDTFECSQFLGTKLASGKYFSHKPKTFMYLILGAIFVGNNFLLHLLSLLFIFLLGLAKLFLCLFSLQHTSRCICQIRCGVYSKFLINKRRAGAVNSCVVSSFSNRSHKPSSHKRNNCRSLSNNHRKFVTFVDFYFPFLGND